MKVLTNNNLEMNTTFEKSANSTDQLPTRLKAQVD